jgi:hypothetical protein
VSEHEPPNFKVDAFNIIYRQNSDWQSEQLGKRSRLKGRDHLFPVLGHNVITFLSKTSDCRSFYWSWSPFPLEWLTGSVRWESLCQLALVVGRKIYFLPWELDRHPFMWGMILFSFSISVLSLSCDHFMRLALYYPCLETTDCFVIPFSWGWSLCLVLRIEEYNSQKLTWETVWAFFLSSCASVSAKNYFCWIADWVEHTV